ncbi:hypothetical protein PPERSA_02892 [Pseudocohnilembus persalinus]|uniref:dATP/dGTP diphosphohydrolase N-terminal domain-containing protein n=1 Tax=Pseudocohnilembus persalinus TaxID=266149 RepID=A0A0V0QMB8_PSEPJ|nr:hypothetical protein PPERSA_02892 [Pseudocohnilembus persalinus]|eukprot:KRX03513.1 hypothetical protein PPERSA_02892 [Pseudocohnilembus persalinus]
MGTKSIPKPILSQNLQQNNTNQQQICQTDRVYYKQDKLASIQNEQQNQNKQNQVQQENVRIRSYTQQQYQQQDEQIQQNYNLNGKQNYSAKHLSFSNNLGQSQNSYEQNQIKINQEQISPKFSQQNSHSNLQQLNNDLSQKIIQNEVINYDSEYIGQIKIYNTGIKEDPIPGEKRGKGVQSLNSSYWLSDLAIFIAENLTVLKHILSNVYQLDQNQPGIDFLILTQQANQLFMKSENSGLQTPESLNHWLMASWLCMAAAEVDNYKYSKYSEKERKLNKEEFYQKYFSAQEVQNLQFLSDKNLGIYATKFSRIDLIPKVALERLGIHNELCVLKMGQDGCQQWKTEGFMVSKRLSSAKRHFDGVHSKDYSEDHIAHLIWNFMAIYHVLSIKPQLNDLVNYEQIKQNSLKEINQKFFDESNIEK